MVARLPLSLMLAAGGVFLPAMPGSAQTAGIEAAYVPTRPVRIAAPADLGPDPATLRPGLASLVVETWYERGRPLASNRAGNRGGDRPGALQTYVPLGAGPTQLSGYIRFDPPGEYRLRILTSDPVRLTIAGLSIYETTERQRDGASPPLPLRITTADWYPIAVVASGESVPELQWQTPDNPQAWAAIPESALAH